MLSIYFLLLIQQVREDAPRRSESCWSVIFWHNSWNS